jgi:HAD superfamily hydrolase (TIGR01509 family)
MWDRDVVLTRALIFDFDGLLVDTETPLFMAWEQIYRDHGYALPRGLWLTIVGGDGGAGFDPARYLEAQTGLKLNPADLDQLERRYYGAFARDQHFQPGVESLVASARQLGLALGIASSSPRAWVMEHLARVGSQDVWDVIVGREDVGLVKPDPALYRLACARLAVQPGEAIAFEDSQNGLAAAQAAGLRCVVVPNPMTTGSDFTRADILVDSLTEVSLVAIMARGEHARGLA